MRFPSVDQNHMTIDGNSDYEQTSRSAKYRAEKSATVDEKEAEVSRRYSYIDPPSATSSSSFAQARAGDNSSSYGSTDTLSSQSSPSSVAPSLRKDRKLKDPKETKVIKEASPSQVYYDLDSASMEESEDPLPSRKHGKFKKGKTKNKQYLSESTEERIADELV